MHRTTNKVMRVRDMVWVMAVSALVTAALFTSGCEDDSPFGLQGFDESTGDVTLDGEVTPAGVSVAQEAYLDGYMLRVADGTLTYRDFSYVLPSPYRIHGTVTGDRVKIKVNGEKVYDSND